MATLRSTLAFALIALAAAIPAGCMWERVEPDPMPLDPSLGPCPSRLHDIGGAILLYYVAHGDMPPDLAAIRTKLAEIMQTEGRPCPPLVCPVSGIPYAYSPNGLEVAGRDGRVILYDATPAHDGRQWGLAVTEVNPGVPVVVLLPKGAVLVPPTTTIAPPTPPR